MRRARLGQSCEMEAGGVVLLYKYFGVNGRKGGEELVLIYSVHMRSVGQKGIMGGSSTPVRCYPTQYVTSSLS